ncbi:MAG: protein-L-isoaspartate(D-aspartate) O-methyltransferase [Deltaproteobacteria bacterium]|nr:protein-L-isoaspartate(D-aspartate) O-methyltransferase [Deltaproteobacteria bacterium]
MDYTFARQKMVEEQIIRRGIKDPNVIRAFFKVPRHLFVEEALQAQAYSDYPLPIGEKQTISQPYIVALMTEALLLKQDDKVLEIGTGSGYQTAILAEIARYVYTVERIKSLSLRARKILEQLGYYNIFYKIDDGTLGWKEEAPFDAIIVTAGAPKIPDALKQQLKEDGRLVIPVGDDFSQDLLRIIRKKGKFFKENLGGCRFVRLIGKQGWKEESF